MRIRLYSVITALLSVSYAQELLLKEVEVKAKKETFKDTLEVREIRESSAKDVGEALGPFDIRHQGSMAGLSPQAQ